MRPTYNRDNGVATLMSVSASPVLKRILIVDDDVQLCGLIRDYILQFSFQLDMAHDGHSGLAKAMEQQYELILLDVMLPKIGGFELLKQLRKRSHIPVIMLTARTQQADRIVGLDAGADDYLPKPFGPDELVARIRAVLRRSSPGYRTSSPVIEHSGIQVNDQTREVWRGGEPVDLTGIEFEVLDYLIRAAGRIVSRDELSIMLYQRPATPYERALDVHISHIRRKLERDERPLIRTVRGVGYIFVSYENAPGETRPGETRQ